MKNFLRKTILTVLFLQINYLSIMAQEATTLVETMVTALMEEAKLPSFSIAVLKDGEIHYAETFGHADIDSQRLATPQTQYRLASVSKLLTTTALAKLVQDGKLAFDQPITEFLPEFPDVEGVTPRLLAGHLGGIAHYQFFSDKINRLHHYQSVDEALSTFQDSPRVGKAGEKYAYSTHGFTLLSAVVEKAAKMPFLKYLDRHLFTRLDMGQTGPDDRTNISPDMSTIYSRNGWEPVVVTMPEDPSYKWGGGGMIGTPTDLIKLAKGYFDGFLTDDILAELWTSQQTNDGEATGVGIGWRIGHDFMGRPIRHHAGSMNGARSVLILYPDEKTAIATTTNIRWSSAIERNAQVLLEALLHSDPKKKITLKSYDLKGTFKGKVTETKLHLDGVQGYLSAPEALKEWFKQETIERLPIFHLHHDWWAMVTPLGILNLELVFDEKNVKGNMQLSEQSTWTFESQ